MCEKADLLRNESGGKYDQFDPFVDISPPTYLQSSNATIPPQHIPPQSNVAASSEVPHRQQASGPSSGVETTHPMFPANPYCSTTTPYPMVYYFGSSQQTAGELHRQHHQDVIFMAGNSRHPGQYGQFGRARSFLWPILISCFVLWLCGVLFGFVAFILAIFGREAAYRGNDRRARCCSKASYGISLVGLCLGVIALVVIGMFWYHSSSSSCPHGHYIYQNRRVCCGEVTCTHGIHLDSTGCLQCCDPYSKTECFKNGHFNDSHGCKICCSTSKDSCSSGFYYDSFGCTKCCSTIYSSSCSYGSYNDSNGCKMCCSMYSSLDCSRYGQYKDGSGCTKCCPYSSSSDCATYGYYFDSNGCKQCCFPFGNYKGDCTCPTTSSSPCQYGNRNVTVGYCNKCCNYYSGTDCTNGYYYDSTGCKTCCGAPGYCYTYGFYYDANSCKTCCTRYTTNRNCTRF